MIYKIPHNLAFVKTVCVVKISEWSTAMTRFISFSFLMRLNDEYV